MQTFLYSLFSTLRTKSVSWNSYAQLYQYQKEPETIDLQNKTQIQQHKEKTKRQLGRKLEKQDCLAKQLARDLFQSLSQ